MSLVAGPPQGGGTMHSGYDWLHDDNVALFRCLSQKKSTECPVSHQVQQVEG